ncbi:LOW QUALITY PROTEIN: free fatty acid receptor 3 [Panthera tigris]|uniref:LOW QUALITY PROTEIN: free fatty acid receptor 3 n=1 Tax=Panthera tigris TaxID=9694 RepID=UPI001C6FA53D|nr:LOW QUALITY PROTEIN: free fatty acid receptor 3 [Panthera tigris]
MGPCPLSPGAGLWVGGSRRLDGQYQQLPGRQHASERLSGLPGGLGPGLSGPCSPQPFSPALLPPPDHHSLLLRGLPPGTGPVRPEPQTEAEGSLGGRRGSAHTAALLRALQRLQRGCLPAPRHGRPLAETGAHHGRLECGAQPVGDWLPGRGCRPGDKCGENERRDIPEAAAAAGEKGHGAGEAGCSRRPLMGTAPKELQGGLAWKHPWNRLWEELSLAEDRIPVEGRRKPGARSQEEVAITMATSLDRSFSPGNHWLYFSVYLFTFLVGLPLNLAALVIFVGKLRRRPVAVDVLLLNLTLSDLLLLLFLPFRMVEAANGMRWPLPFIFCPLSGSLFFTTLYLTSLFLAAVSVERFLSVAYPLWYKARPRPGQAGLVSGACWLLAAAHCSVVYVMEFSGKATKGTCYLEFQKDQLAILLPVRLEMAVVLFGVPLLITIYCYSHLVWVLSRGTNHRRRRRVVGLVVATLLNFLVCFGPYNVSHVVGYIQGESPAWRSYVLLLSTLNSCVDPLVYYFSSSGFQADFQGLLRRLMGAWGPWRQEDSMQPKDKNEEGQPGELSNVENRRETPGGLWSRLGCRGAWRGLS